jgi:hypothetical protein
MFFNPSESTTRSLAWSQMGYMWVLSPKNAFSQRHNLVAGEWPNWSHCMDFSIFVSTTVSILLKNQTPLTTQFPIQLWFWKKSLFWSTTDSNQTPLTDCRHLRCNCIVPHMVKRNEIWFFWRHDDIIWFFFSLSFNGCHVHCVFIFRLRHLFTSSYNSFPLASVVKTLQRIDLLRNPRENHVYWRGFLCHVCMTSNRPHLGELTWIQFRRRRQFLLLALVLCILINFISQHQASS